MKEFTLILPMVILAFTLAMVIFAEITYHGERTRWVGATALTGLGAAFLQTLISFRVAPDQLFDRAITIDGVSLFFQTLFIVHAAMSIVSAVQTREILEDKKTEYSVLVLSATLAMSLLASASDLLMVFLCLQFLNILAFFLAGYGKESARSAEAGIKYMIFWAVSSAMILYGMAALFAATHSLNLQDIQSALIQTPLSKEAALAIFSLFLIGFCFQVGAFPMYLWVPDVLEGAPTPASGFLSFGLRGAGFAFGLRFFNFIFAQKAKGSEAWSVLGAVDWPQIFAWIAGITLMIGSVLAVRQKSAKRLVACLLVSQTGFFLMGMLVSTHGGAAALFYNLIVEVFAVVGVFYLLAFLRDELGSDLLVHLKGALAHSVSECIYLVLFMACLVGMPPTPGFFGKFTLIGAAAQQGWNALAFVSVISMMLSMAAVARFSYFLVGDFRQSLESRGTAAVALPSRSRQTFLLCLAIPLLMITIGSQLFLNWAGKALSTILW